MTRLKIESSVEQRTSCRRHRSANHGRWRLKSRYASYLAPPTAPLHVGASVCQPNAPCLSRAATRMSCPSNSKSSLSMAVHRKVQQSIVSLSISQSS